MPSQSDTDVKRVEPKKPVQPSVWKGFIDMAEVAKFVTTGHRVSGPADFLKQVYDPGADRAFYQWGGVDEVWPTKK